ncbi:MAG TPA: hypothetical protein VIL55_07150 [Naasia sp.]|jgi:hypothetical protein
MRERGPGHAPAALCLAAHAAEPRIPALARLLGFSPLRGAAAQRYERALFEAETALSLRRLPADWTVLHSVPLAESRVVVPHLAIGPAGVFALFPDPRPDAQVWLSGDLLTVDGVPSEALADAEAAAHEIAVRLGDVLPRSVGVVPVVTFVAPRRVLVRSAPRTARVLPMGEVAGWLRSLPEVCSALQVDRLADTAELPEVWGMRASAVAGGADLAPVHTEVAAAELRWQRALRVLVAAATAISATSAIGLAALLGVFGG